MAACALALSCAALAEPLGCEGGSQPSQLAQSSRYTVRFRLVPEPQVARHFAVLFTVCGQAGAASPETVSLDARMPRHGHGMNYRPTIVALGSGGFRAEGLMLHMPGQWELMFEVRAAGSSDRITYPLILR